jgi:molecular chaperone Hsp33
MEEPAFPAGRLVAALAAGGRVRVLAVVIPGPANELVSRHGLEPAAAKRATEVAVSAVLLAAHIKGEERVTVDVQSNSPVFATVVEVSGEGSPGAGATLRGRFRPEVLRDQPEFFGAFSVMKSLGRRELWRSVAMADGESVETLLQRQLRESQQVAAKVRIGGSVDAEGRVELAVGLLVEALPGFEAEEFEAWVAPIATAPLDELMEAFAFGRLGAEEIEVIGATDLRFHCGCSRERVEATLRALGPAEIAAMIADQGGAEVTCHFCNEAYRFDVAALEELRGEVGEG